MASRNVYSISPYFGFTIFHFFASKSLNNRCSWYHLHGHYWYRYLCLYLLQLHTSLWITASYFLGKVFFCLLKPWGPSGNSESQNAASLIHMWMIDLGWANHKPSSRIFMLEIRKKPLSSWWFNVVGCCCPSVGLRDKGKLLKKIEMGDKESNLVEFHSQVPVILELFLHSYSSSIWWWASKFSLLYILA